MAPVHRLPVSSKYWLQMTTAAVHVSGSRIYSWNYARKFPGNWLMAKIYLLSQNPFSITQCSILLIQLRQVEATENCSHSLVRWCRCTGGRMDLVNSGPARHSHQKYALCTSGEAAATVEVSGVAFFILELHRTLPYRDVMVSSQEPASRSFLTFWRHSFRTFSPIFPNILALRWLHRLAETCLERETHGEVNTHSILYTMNRNMNVF